MNLKVFLFKMSIIVYHIAILTFSFLPFTLALIALRESRVKYGFSFFELSFSTALFIAFALGLAAVCYNALVFEKFKKLPLAGYLKSTQKVKLVSSIQGSNIEKAIEIALNGRRWKLLDHQKNVIVLTRKSVPTNSIVKFEKENDQWSLSSKPKYKIWFVDFGKNYKNILELLGYLKNSK